MERTRGSGRAPLAGDLSRVPAELRSEARWVCWRREERGGKATKLPVDARTGRMAKSTDPKTWASFDEAVAAVGRWRCDGVGFVFGPDRAYTGLDLDHVLAGGSLDAEYRWVVDEAGTYTEVSPSGDGLHLIFRGAKPDWARRSRRGQPGGRVVEMYDRDRYFTVTGDVFEGRDVLRSNPAVVERAYRTWIEPEAAPAAQPALAAAAGAADTDDEALIERMYASRSGEAIRALMAGDCSAQGGDRSAADMALCSHLAFWCAGDAARMDRIFRTSGLMRDKWDSRRGGSTYGAQTIARAVEGCTEFYRPATGRSGTAAPSGKNTCSTSSAPPHGKGSEPEPSFDPGRPPSAGTWRADGDGALWATGPDGELRYMVSSTAPWVAADLVDVDTGAVRALVRVAMPTGTVERALPREDIMSQNRIVAALAPLGANVSSANARDIVRYLTDCERAHGAKRPRLRSVTHLGWADGPLSPFMPYDAGGDVRFDPAPDEAVKARPFTEPAGTLAGWVAGVGPRRAASPAFRAVLAASFASALVGVVGVQPFIVYLWGRSRSGKTPTLKAAGSVWGDPTEGAEGYFRTFADTPKSIVRAAALLHDIPLIVDELQAKGAPGGQAGKRQLVEDLLYSLSLGRERGALNSDRSMMRTGSWRSLTIATGEIPIVGDATQQGAANRTLELNAEPFSDVRAAQAMHRLVAEQHGTAGRAFVAALRGNPLSFYREQFAVVRDTVASASKGHPQTDNAALLGFADALAGFYVFEPGSDWAACLEAGYTLAAWALAHATGAQAGDTDLKAMQFVSEWLARGAIHFQRYCEDDRVERWGEYEEFGDRPGGRYWVFSSVLDRALADAGFDRQKTLRRMDDEGALALGGTGRGYTRQRRFGGIRVRCLVIDGPALEAAIARAQDGAAGGPASRGGAPC